MKLPQKSIVKIYEIPREGAINRVLPNPVEPKRNDLVAVGAETLARAC